MPSFDIVSEVDKHEVKNAIDQANREVGTRYDFKGVDASFECSDLTVALCAQADIQIKLMLDILQQKLFKRGVDIACLECSDIIMSGMQAKMEVKLREGIEITLAKRIVKMIKNQKIKVQAAIQNEQVRVTGKKRDDLQSVMAMLKTADIDMPLQYKNFRD